MLQFACLSPSHVLPDTLLKAPVEKSVGQLVWNVEALQQTHILIHLTHNG